MNRCYPHGDASEPRCCVTPGIWRTLPGMILGTIGAAAVSGVLVGLFAATAYWTFIGITALCASLAK